MKAQKTLYFVFCLWAISAAAQANAPADMPANMLSTNWRQWQLDGVTLVFLAGLAGRAIKGLQAGGGIVGAIKGILFGTNVPTPSKDAPPK